MPGNFFQGRVLDQTKFPASHHVARAVDHHVRLRDSSLTLVTGPHFFFKAVNLADSLSVHVCALVDPKRNSCLPAEV